MDSKEWYIIINPHAGSGKTISVWNEAQALLDAYGVHYTTVITNYRHHASELAYAAASEGRRRILTVGGDGTLHEAFCGVCRWCEENSVDPCEFLLGVIPIGSGNDWIKSVGLPSDMEEMVKVIAAAKSQPMDIVKMTWPEGESYMVNVGGVGFDSHVCDRVNFQKSTGIRHKMLYATALKDTIANLKPLGFSIVADGQEWFNGEVYSVALGTGKYSGGGMRQVPDASINDGLIDFMVVPKAPVYKILAEVPRLFNGTVSKSRLVLSGRCSVLEIVPLNAFSADIVELDGEIEGRLPVRLEVTGKQAGVLSR